MAQTKSTTQKAAASQKSSSQVGTNGTGFIPNSAIPIPVTDTMQFGAVSMKHFMEASQDMAKFYNRRLRKDSSFMSELGTCKSPQQGAAVWFRAASEAAHEYVDQLDRFVAITLDSSSSE